MPATVRYQKYQLSSEAGKEILSTDFGTDVLVEREHITQVIRDLVNFSGIGEKAFPYKSVVEIATNQDVINIERDYSKLTSSLTSQKQTDPNFFWLPDDIAEHAVDDRNPFVVFPVAPAQYRAELVRLLPKIKDLLSAEERDSKYKTKDEVLDRIKELGATQLEQLTGIDSQLVEIEGKLSKQRQVDEAQLSVSDLESKMSEILKTLKDVDDLVKAQRDMQSRLHKYSKMLGEPVIAQAQKLRAEVENIRKQKLEYESEIIDEFEVEPTEADSGLPQKPKFAKFLLFLPLVLITISVIGFFLTRNYFILALGISGGIVESLLFLAVNSVEPDIDIDQAETRTVTKQRLKPGLKIDNERVSRIKQFFIDKAWAAVLQTEVTALQEAIQNQLGDQNVDQIQLAQQDIESELTKVKSLIKSHEGQDIPPEEYLKLRRKLDTLKVEKSKLETELGKLEEQEEIESLRRRLAELTEREELSQKYSLPEDIRFTFIAKLTENYLGATIDKNQLWLFSKSAGRWVTDPIDDTDLLSIYVYTRLLFWQSEQSLPVVLVDVVGKLPDKARSVIEQKIRELHQIGQIIVVEPKV